MILEKIKLEFEKRSKKNPAYSMRSFANSLDMNSSTLSSLLSGKRILTFKAAQKILDRIDFSQIEKKEMLLSEYFKKSIKINSKILSDEELEMISNWEHFAVLALIETKKFENTKRYISETLDIPIATVILVLDRLEKLKFIKIENNEIRILQQSIATTHDVPSSALRKANKQYIEKAIYSLENHSTSDRDMTGTTFAIQKSKLPEAKKLIQNFRESMSEFLESGEKEDVYRLNIQLFPIKK
jgi:uncharacterized protein (TIGR02147 family)